MTLSRHERFEELISASLSGDLSDSERAQLDAHLDGCAACRATLASFAEQRRIMSGLRHVAPPRDLGARVRTGVERGAFATTPWWRRPAVMFAGLGGGLAAVAGALLAIVLLNGTPGDPNVGAGSESPLPSFTSAAPSAAPVSQPPSATPVASEPVATPAPTATPPEASPEPDVFLAYTGPFDNLLLTLRDGETGDTIRELEGRGPVVAAQLSPNGQFLAYITQMGESGRNEINLLHFGVDPELRERSDALIVDTTVPEGTTVSLGETAAGSEFLERLEWSPDAQYLSYTLASPDGAGTDVWVFVSASGERHQLTDVAAGYTGSWLAGRNGSSYLWVSVADEQPISYVIAFGDDAGPPPAGDPAQQALLNVPGIFQPLVSPDGSGVIYWRGIMQQRADEWLFAEGGAPYIADAPVDGNAQEFTNERPLFADVTIDRDSFTSAGIVWGADSDAYAVWGAQWTGVSQGSRGEYPSPSRVYFGHASDERNLTELHAIDEADLDPDATVIDVKVPTGRHLLITAQLPIGGVMDVPRAQLLLVTRNTGSVPDEVERFEGPGDDAWFGPAAIDAYWEVTVD